MLYLAVHLVEFFVGAYDAQNSTHTAIAALTVLVYDWLLTLDSVLKALSYYYRRYGPCRGLDYGYLPSPSDPANLAKEAYIPDLCLFHCEYECRVSS